MNDELSLENITPTVFLRKAGDSLEQRVRVKLHNPAGRRRARISVESSGGRIGFTDLEVPEGEIESEVFIPELNGPTQLSFSLHAGDRTIDRQNLRIVPPRHWKVHVVQLSHHDPGYTDLASTVVREHDRWLDAAINMADETSGYPETAQFRIVVEQAWSMDHFLRNAREERARRMVQLMRSGRVELTALFGNMVTGLCGHETLARCTYPAARIAREYDVPVVSAEHNDVPGFSWGLSQVLLDAGVEIFCPGLPRYYGWGEADAAPLWDEAAIFGYEGMPGAFWWEAPDGERLLFWCNNSGCGGDCRGSLPALPGRLWELENDGYPHGILRWPVIGGQRDNSPYIRDYADTIRRWNEKWAYPRLVCSTNARFLRDFRNQVHTSELPVHRGDLPGQDYPVGAASTAGPTAVNRNNHRNLPAAEAWATIANLQAPHPYPADDLNRATSEVLWHDEHAWGHHFPAGPTSEAAEHEKAVRAHRGAALAHGVAEKARAAIADRVQVDESCIHLVVFNPCPRERAGYVSAPLRELDNCGSEMVEVPPAEDPEGEGFLRGVLLNDRWHVNPPPDLVNGQFELVDAETETSTPYQIHELESPLDPQPHAAARLGLGKGGRRYGFFEEPAGIRRLLCFRAGPVPGLGYRTYRLVPSTKSKENHKTSETSHGCNSNCEPDSELTGTADTLQNRHYRLEIDPDTGCLRSLIHRANRRQWVDREAAHQFGHVIVRNPSGDETVANCLDVSVVEAGPLRASVRAQLEVAGHPQMELTYHLRAEEQRIGLSLTMLKGPEPLLETYLAFPFALPEGQLTAETPFCTYAPAVDRLPGSFANRVAVQDWVRLTDGSSSVLWSSLDAAVISPGRLWPSRVSPAHSCVTPHELDNPPQNPDELRGGTIYSLLTANNFGTNFAVSQEGTLRFRYEFAPRTGRTSTAEAARFGRSATRPLQTIFTKHPGNRTLPVTGEFLEIDDPAVQLTALKKAEDGSAIILRLWNTSGAPRETTVRFPSVRIRKVRRTNVTEQKSRGTVQATAHRFNVRMKPNGICTLEVFPDDPVT